MLIDKSNDEYYFSIFDHKRINEMLSKKNVRLMIEKQQPRKQRFGLRKLSIGVVSVLLGLFFIGGGNRAAADDQAPTTEAVASTAVMSTNSGQRSEYDRQCVGGAKRCGNE